METRPAGKDTEPDRIAFGEFLRRAREQRQLTLEQISDETKIAPRLLTSLEEGNLQPMPKGMYRRAMLRAYAESVGLDTEAALTQFERTFEEPRPPQAPVRQTPVPPRAEQAPATAMSNRPPRKAVIAGVALALVGGLGAWIWSADEEPYVPVQSAVAAAASAASHTAPASASESAPRRSDAAAQPVTTAPPPVPSPTRREVAATSGRRGVTAAAAAPAIPTTPRPAPRATEGKLVVISEPSGARVTVNGVGWGATPLTIPYLPLGEKRVRLTKDGYVSQERTVRVDGERPNATVRLTLKQRP